MWVLSTNTRSTNAPLLLHSVAAVLAPTEPFNTLRLGLGRHWRFGENNGETILEEGAPKREHVDLRLCHF